MFRFKKQENLDDYVALNVGGDEKGAHEVRSEDGGNTWYFMAGEKKVFLSDEEVAEQGLGPGMKCGALGDGVRRPVERQEPKFDPSCWNTRRKYEFLLLLLIGGTIAAFVWVFFR